jgi:predicted exporter
VVELAMLALRRSPSLPAIGLVQNIGIFLAIELRLHGPLLFQAVEVFQERQEACSV